MRLDPTIRIDKASERRLLQALDEFPVAVQDKLTKGALRQFAKYQMGSIAPKNKNLNPKHLKFRIKMWPSGITWLGVGYRQIPGVVPFDAKGRKLREQYDSLGVGWRSHFEELGFHTWSTFFSISGPRAKGRGWKRGLRHRGRGQYIRGTKASEIAAKATAPALLPFLKRELEFFLAQKVKGKRARRKRLVLEGSN